MKHNTKKLLALTLITALAVSGVGCGKTASAVTVTPDTISMYTNSVLCSVSDTGANADSDITSVKGHKVPNLSTENADVNYFTPMFDGEIKSVTFKEKFTETDGEVMDEVSSEPTAEEKSLTDTAIKMAEEADKQTPVAEKIDGIKQDGKDITAFYFTKAGKYTVEVEKDEKVSNIDVLVKDGSYLDDMLNGETPLENTIVNTNSKEFTNLVAEYENSLPLMLKDYLDKYESKDEAIKAFETENANVLAEFNRLKKLQGEETVSVNEVFDTYGTDAKIEAAASAMNDTIDISKRGYVAKSISANSENGVAVSDTGKTYYDVAYEVFLKINEIRKANNLGQLTWSAPLYNMAVKRAEEITTNFSHTSASNTYFGSGENIAWTSKLSADMVVNGWMNSAGHRANILGAQHITTAIAVIESNGRYYWVHGFGSGREMYVTEGDPNVTADVIYGNQVNKIVAGTPKNVIYEERSTAKVPENATYNGEKYNPQTVTPTGNTSPTGTPRNVNGLDAKMQEVDGVMKPVVQSSGWVTAKVERFNSNPSDSYINWDACGGNINKFNEDTAQALRDNDIDYPVERYFSWNLAIPEYDEDGNPTLTGGNVGHTYKYLIYPDGHTETICGWWVNIGDTMVINFNTGEGYC